MSVKVLLQQWDIPLNLIEDKLFINGCE